MHEFNHIAEAIENAMKRLLSEKHVYQAVEPDLNFIPELAQKVLNRVCSWAVRWEKLSLFLPAGYQYQQCKAPAIRFTVRQEGPRRTDSCQDFPPRDVH
jgi:hypothetical protein